MPRLRSAFAFALLAVALVGPAPARAQDVIPPKVLVRRFPQGQFCALPVSITFTAPAAPVVVTFTALQFVPDFSNQLTWTGQAIDNFTAARSSVVAANFEGPPAGGSSQNCYIGDPAPTSYFHFNRSGLAIDLLERFDTDPVVRGWDLSSGAVFDNSRSGPRNVETDTDLTGGSIRFGAASDPPLAGSTKSTSITLNGLAPGVSYDVGAWWFADFVRFPHDTNYLTITVTTPNGTPVARRSWGALKSTYR